MNGRIERRDARLELAINSEPNYATVEFLFDEVRREKRRKLIFKWVPRIAVALLCFWLINRNLDYWIEWLVERGLR